MIKAEQRQIKMLAKSQSDLAAGCRDQYSLFSEVSEIKQVQKQEENRKRILSRYKTIERIKALETGTKNVQSKAEEPLQSKK
mmetsp:Transcript_15565/g.21095  ORF Transcript_15565/g.21095 Transcript_15565/m.21095 type:complete len:82 (-) Transcript_15565:485-730(-)|eukprot:CAMPEP_0185596526 /NCGR_PEP_ID=MMETSP0434-20130131/80809_1 /TAXON_ID=626734 ORGANISM="Favella taraikaensis, Strain Fe Narragansett Bay" /NCGR_SAMPLE_ID=MMETSP0434 /ASSEMBLY_ACC=CAM_ASM_000379 /LENGTH=81 /DNA_ID=CAMNT_0028225045 /DNA_START=1417 /DNA_END=1662 /DNA_ORIENTATION=-